MQLLHFLWGVPGGTVSDLLWDCGIICFLLRCLYVVIQRMNCFVGFAARCSLHRRGSFTKKERKIGNREKTEMEKKGKSAPRYLTLHGPLLISTRSPRSSSFNSTYLSQPGAHHRMLYILLNISAYVPVVCWLLSQLKLEINLFGGKNNCSFYFINKVTPYVTHCSNCLIVRLLSLVTV